MNLVEEIKARLKLEELIAETLTVVGRGAVRTTKEHDSLKIWLATQTWHQFSTGDGGDLFDWYMRTQKCDFRTALEELARRAGVEPRQLTSEERVTVERQREERRTVEAIWAMAASYYVEVMAGPDGQPGRDYCAGRGWTQETIEREQVGYCAPSQPPPGGRSLGGDGDDSWGDNKPLSTRLRDAGWLDQPVAKAVLSIPPRCIVYVHRDERGRVVYLSGRSIEGKRHFNLLEDNAGQKRTYLNQRAIRRQGDKETRIDARLLVEGQADAISLGQLGVEAVALCGVDSTGSSTVGEISHVALDNDKTGQAKALDVALGVDPLCKVVNWPKTLKHSEEGKGSVEIKDAADLLRTPVTVVEIGAWLEAAPAALVVMAGRVGKATNGERKELIKRFFQLYTGLDNVTAADMRPDLAKAMGVGVQQFKSLLKAHLAEVEAGEEKEKEYSERHVISPGGYIGGYLFEQCVQFLDNGEMEAYYWVRTPEGKFEKVKSLKIGESMYWPVDPREEELIRGRDVLFANDREESGNEAKLLEDIREFIHYWLDVPAHYENIASYYVLLTWFYDAGYETIPYLRALGEYGSGKSRFINTIGYLCFRPMLFGGGDSEATIYYTLETFKGTMIIDESDFKKSDEAALISKIINMGNNRRGSIKRMDPKPDNSGLRVRRFNVFGPKIFGAREGFGDQASDSRCLTHYTTSMILRPDVPLDLTEDFDTQAQRLRNRLLDFRLKHWKPVKVNPNDVDRTVMARLAQITLALKSIIHDPVVLDELVRFVRLYNQSLIGDRQMTDSAIVVEALVRIRYPQPAGIPMPADWTIMHVAEVAQEVMNDFDPEQKMTPKRVGSILSKQLGVIRRGKRERSGRSKIEIDDTELNGLMLRYGIEKPEWEGI